MINQTLTLKELKQQQVEKMLMDIVKQHMVVTIRLPGGEEASNH